MVIEPACGWEPKNQGSSGISIVLIIQKWRMTKAMLA